MSRRVSRTLLLHTRERAATAVEYAMMAGLIAAVIVGAVALFGTAVANLFVVPASAF